MGWRPDADGPGGDSAGVDVANLRRVAGISALVVTTIQTACAAVALPRRRRDYADSVWGPGLAAVAVTGAVAGSGDRVRRWALAAAVGGWAARLEHHMLGRVRTADKEDPRYTEFLDGSGTAAVIGKVFLTQGLAQMIVSAPLQVAAASRVPGDWRRWLVPAGLTMMLAGAVTEALADRQKDRYSQLDKDEKPDILDADLWAWSRHPNYFGDSVVWDGAWLTAATSPAGLATVPAPALMTYFLMYATGARRTERRMRDRPGYRDYQQRVSFFFPRPGKHASS
jgi:steroid 5-alpha reductase family enzyme